MQGIRILRPQIVTGLSLFEANIQDCPAFHLRLSQSSGSSPSTLRTIYQKDLVTCVNSVVDSTRVHFSIAVTLKKERSDHVFHFFFWLDYASLFMVLDFVLTS